MCLLLGVLLGRGARAEAPAPSDTPSADEGRRGEAKTRFVRGLELAEQSEWHAALAEFLASLELFRTRAALRNVAFSLQKLGRYAEAFDRYVELRADPALPDAERAALEQTLGELRPRIGSLAIGSTVQGATVIIDGQTRGRTPLPGALNVNAGLHVVRVVKEGFEPFQLEVTVAGGQRRTVEAGLLRWSHVARLEVREASGKKLDVLVDGTVAGSTPYAGPVRAGQRSVALRGPGRLGTAPVKAELRAAQTFVLTLRATELDADVRIEPTPSNARIDVDGVALGAGIWEGRLASGEHTLEVYAEGHLPHRRRVNLHRGAQVLRVRLERDTRGPLWSFVDPRQIYVELSGGLAWAPSFGGSADAACASGGCAERQRPFGALGVLRAGYGITPTSGFELLAGYLHLSATTVRRASLESSSVGVRYDVRDFEEQTRLSAPLAGIAVSQRFFDRFPLVARVSTGVARARVRTAVRGTFRATIAHPDYDDVVVDYRERAGLLEEPRQLWIPFTAGELRLGYRATAGLTVDVGLGAWFLFAPSYPRTGGLFGGDDRAFTLPPRSFDLPEERPGVKSVPNATVSLPRAEALGTMVVLSPSIGARYRF